ncbi:MAG: hypothetical protein HY459_00520 [Parcubacteria group bacterium]|nr:hypothetical protein [Parcubacteria group bacterium]
MSPIEAETIKPTFRDYWRAATLTPQHDEFTRAEARAWQDLRRIAGGLRFTTPFLVPLAIVALDRAALSVAHAAGAGGGSLDCPTGFTPTTVGPADEKMHACYDGVTGLLEVSLPPPHNSLWVSVSDYCRRATGCIADVVARNGAALAGDGVSIENHSGGPATLTVTDINHTGRVIFSLPPGYDSTAIHLSQTPQPAASEIVFPPWVKRLESLSYYATGFLSVCIGFISLVSARMQRGHSPARETRRAEPAASTGPYISPEVIAEAANQKAWNEQQTRHAEERRQDEERFVNAQVGRGVPPDDARSEWYRRKQGMPPWSSFWGKSYEPEPRTASRPTSSSHELLNLAENLFKKNQDQKPPQKPPPTSNPGRWIEGEFTVREP